MLETVELQSEDSSSSDFPSDSGGTDSIKPSASSVSFNAGEEITNTDPILLADGQANLVPCFSRSMLKRKRVIDYITWTFYRIFSELGTRELCLLFAEDRRLLPTTRMCHQHRRQMELCDIGIVGAFKCYKQNCRVPQVDRSLNTWFENVTIPLPILFRIMYCFTKDYNYTQTQKECLTPEMDEPVPIETIENWFDYCRETIIVYMSENTNVKDKIGGPGKVVQIYEHKLKQGKYARRNRLDCLWMIGMIEVDSEDLRLEICSANNSKEMLIPHIEKNVQAGSEIHTDSWCAFLKLLEHGYIHKIVSGSDPENPSNATDERRKEVKSQWHNLKNLSTNMNYRGAFNEYSVEYVWKSNVINSHLDEFEELIKCISYVYRI